MTTKDYTAALYCAVYETDDDGDDFYINGILSAVENLAKRERYVIEHYYRYGETYTKIGKTLSVTSERVRQIKCKSLRKLRNPQLVCKISVKDLESQRNNLRLELEEAKKLISEQNELIADLLKKLPREETIESPILPDGTFVLLEELELTARSFNCLTRRGLRTASDLMKLPADEFIGIRNLGTMSQLEVIGKMRANGFEVWADRIEKEI